MVQAHTSSRGHATRALATAAASTPDSAELMGAIVDFVAALRRSPDAPSAAGPLLVRLAAEGPLRACDLAHMLGLDQSTVSRHIAALEADGLVRRDPQADDRRARLLEATPLGIATAQERVSARVRHFESALADWADTDVRTLGRLLTRFVDGLAVAEGNHA